MHDNVNDIGVVKQAVISFKCIVGIILYFIGKIILKGDINNGK
jgi:hypothetical protein